MGFLKKLKKKLTTLNIEDKKEIKSISTKEQVEMKKTSFSKEKKFVKKQKKLDKYINGLEKSSLSFSEKLKSLFVGNRLVDEDFFEELEDILIMSDISVKLVTKIISKVKLKTKAKKLKTDLILLN